MVNKQLLEIIKLSAGACTIPLCIPVGKPVEAFLRPVATNPAYINSSDVKLLTDYRNRFVNSFLTEFEATETQTKRWLTNYVSANSSKILFMLDDINGSTFGYMGIDLIDWDKSYCEADAIVRGGDAPRGIMKKALLTLLGWARQQLGLKNIGVRVLSDNPAVDFYKKVGFQEIKQVPLKKTEEQNKISWNEDESVKNPERYLVHMILSEKLQTV